MLLKVVNVAGQSWSIEVGEVRQVIGRAPDVAINIQNEHRSVSRRHAELWCDRRGCWICDLNSKCGTQINGVSLEPGRPYQVRIGDRIHLGALELVLMRQSDLSAHVLEESDSDRIHRSSGDTRKLTGRTKTAPLPPEFVIGQLTHAEREVVLWISRGCTSLDEIGQKLFRSPNTVRTQLNRIFKKLGVHSREELIGFIRRSNLPDASDG